MQMQGRQLSTGGILRRDKLEEMEIARGKSERLEPGGGLSRSLDGGFMGEMDMSLEGVEEGIEGMEM